MPIVLTAMLMELSAINVKLASKSMRTSLVQQPTVLYLTAWLAIKPPVPIASPTTNSTQMELNAFQSAQISTVLLALDPTSAASVPPPTVLTLMESASSTVPP